jgi:hypothetical protein
VSKPTKLRLVTVGDGNPLEPYANVDEAIAEAKAAWQKARRLHLRILAVVGGASMLRLQNYGALPREDGPRDINVYTLSGLAKELREIEELADQAASALEVASQRMWKK